MNNLYEYIDPIASPYEVFLFDSNTSPLPIPAHWHYYAELLYIHQGTITVSMDNTLVTGTRLRDPFSTKMYAFNCSGKGHFLFSILCD